MFDYRLRVFYTVAKRSNFTKAADELCITQPAVSKHIREIEKFYKIRLFERNGNPVKLTPAGKILFDYCVRIFDLYSELEFDLNALTGDYGGKLRIGASTTIAQYVLPPILAEFHKRYSEIGVSMSIDNSERIEAALKDNEIDLGIVEGRSTNNMFKYTDFVRDEIVATVSGANRTLPGKSLTIDKLMTMPILLREPGSGTLEVIAHELKKHNIKLSDLNCQMRLGSTESLKSYLLHSDCAAFLSLASISNELLNNDLRIIKIDGLNLERTFRFIRLYGENEGLPELFIEFARRHK